MRGSRRRPKLISPTMIRPREFAAMAPLTGADLEQCRRDCSVHAFLHLCWRQEVAWGATPELQQARAGMSGVDGRLVRSPRRTI